MNQNPYLSLCIPTNGATHWVLPTIESIYSQNCDFSCFEVVIADNGTNSDLAHYIEKLDFPNLHYYKTDAEGFTNIINALQLSSGKLIRMLNHRSKLLPGVIDAWVNLAVKYEQDKPLIYFSGGGLRQPIIECENIDGFVREMSYYTSWSAGFSLWDKDKDQLCDILIDKMFPTTSILFEIRKNSRFVIENTIYQEMQSESGKGGYNLFKAFAVDYLDILNSLRRDNRIQIDTFLKVKRDLFKFLRRWYIIIILDKGDYTFEMDNMCENFQVYYTRLDYYYLIITASILWPLSKLKKAIKSILK